MNDDNNMLNDVAGAIASSFKDATLLMEELEPHSVTVDRKRSALRTLLESMEVPDMRRDTSARANIHWLNRNLRIDNSDDPMIATATGLVRWLLKEGA